MPLLGLFKDEHIFGMFSLSFTDKLGLFLTWTIICVVFGMHLQVAWLTPYGEQWRQEDAERLKAEDKAKRKETIAKPPLADQKPDNTNNLPKPPSNNNPPTPPPARPPSILSNVNPPSGRNRPHHSRNETPVTSRKTSGWRPTMRKSCLLSTISGTLLTHRSSTTATATATIIAATTTNRSTTPRHQPHSIALSSKANSDKQAEDNLPEPRRAKNVTDTDGVQPPTDVITVESAKPTDKTEEGPTIEEVMKNPSNHPISTWPGYHEPGVWERCSNIGGEKPQVLWFYTGDDGYDYPVWPKPYESLAEYGERLGRMAAGKAPIPSKQQGKQPDIGFPMPGKEVNAVVKLEDTDSGSVFHQTPSEPMSSERQGVQPVIELPMPEKEVKAIATQEDTNSGMILHQILSEPMSSKRQGEQPVINPPMSEMNANAAASQENMDSNEVVHQRPEVPKSSKRRGKQPAIVPPVLKKANPGKAVRQVPSTTMSSRRQGKQPVIGPPVQKKQANAVQQPVHDLKKSKDATQSISKVADTIEDMEMSIDQPTNKIADTWHLKDGGANVAGKFTVQTPTAKKSSSSDTDMEDVVVASSIASVAGDSEPKQCSSSKRRKFSTSFVRNIDEVMFDASHNGTASLGKQSIDTSSFSPLTATSKNKPPTKIASRIREMKINRIIRSRARRS